MAKRQIKEGKPLRKVLMVFTTLNDSDVAWMIANGTAEMFIFLRQIRHELFEVDLQNELNLFQFYPDLGMDGGIAIQSLNRMFQYSQFYNQQMQGEYLEQEQHEAEYQAQGIIQ